VVILLRSLSGHFTAERHFAFEGGGLVLALRRCGLADAVRLRLLGVTGNETKPETEQQQAGTAIWTIRCARSAHAPSARRPPGRGRVEQPGKQAADYGQQQQNNQHLSITDSLDRFPCLSMRARPANRQGASRRQAAFIGGLLLAVLLPTFISLGLWQWRKAEVKTDLQVRT
jgi:hypothetical protein